VRGLVRTGGAFPLRDRGSVSLKGLSEPVHLYEVIWSKDQAAETRLLAPSVLPMPRPPQFPAGASPLVGREQQLTAVRGCIVSLAEGRGGTLLIGGDAGIGKSRLLREVLTESR